LVVTTHDVDYSVDMYEMEKDENGYFSADFTKWFCKEHYFEMK
jgi:hypothetical protein